MASQSQTTQVLLCVQCTAFQVHIVKKAKKWDCKLCGTRQTLQRVFGTGTGAECRNIVQKLNAVRGQVEQDAKDSVISEVPEICTTSEESENRDQNSNQDFPCTSNFASSVSKSQGGSQWAEFLEGNVDEITEAGHSSIRNYLY